MTRFDSCGTYQVSVTYRRAVFLHGLGNDLVSERVDLLTHLPATPAKDPISPTFRGLATMLTVRWLGRGILSKWGSSGISSDHRIEFRGPAPEIWIFLAVCLLNQTSIPLPLEFSPLFLPCVSTRLAAPR